MLKTIKYSMGFILLLVASTGFAIDCKLTDMKGKPWTIKCGLTECKVVNSAGEHHPKEQELNDYVKEVSGVPENCDELKKLIVGMQE